MEPASRIAAMSEERPLSFVMDKGSGEDSSKEEDLEGSVLNEEEEGEEAVLGPLLTTPIAAESGASNPL